MVARDLLELANRAGGAEPLPEWFGACFADPAAAVAEWDAYLAGHDVCLRSVTPENIVRKGELVAAIECTLKLRSRNRTTGARDCNGWSTSSTSSSRRSRRTTASASAAPCHATG